MKKAEEIIEARRTQLLGMKEKDCAAMPTAETTSKTTGKHSFAISENRKEPNTDCPYGLCDGSGIVWVAEENGGYPCKCMELRNGEQRMRFACIPEEFRTIKVNDFAIEAYREAEGQQLAYTAKKAAIRYIERFAELEKLGKGLYFYSREKGSGKTMLMIAMGNALMRVHQKRVRFAALGDLLEEIRKTFQHSAASAGESYSEMLEEIKEVDILLLDDLGAERATEWVNEVFYNILNRRMTAKKITFFTSNFKMEELPYHPRTIARIDKMAMPVKFPEESIRKRISQQENEEMMQFLMND